MTEAVADERSREERVTDERSREELWWPSWSPTAGSTTWPNRWMRLRHKAVCSDHLIVVDNDSDDRVRDLVAGQPIPTTYLGSRRNLGGAGGFALGMLHALASGADWVWLADDDGRPADGDVLATLLDCARPARTGRGVADGVRSRRPGSRWRFRCGAGWCGGGEVSELRTGGAEQDLLPGIASLFNGALFRASTVEAVGVPDLRLFMRGDEVELHRRLVRSGLPFGTCLNAVYLHPQGGDEFKPILGGRMHTQYPDDATKRFFTYRNRGYLLSQPGMRKLLPQEWLRFGWFFLVVAHGTRPAWSSGFGCAAWDDGKVRNR